MHSRNGTGGKASLTEDCYYLRVIRIYGDDGHSPEWGYLAEKAKARRRMTETFKDGGH